MVAILAAEDACRNARALPGFRLNAPRELTALFRRWNPCQVVDDADMADVSGFADEERRVVFREGQAYEFELSRAALARSHGIHDGEIEAPMPGKVTAVEVSNGEKVAKGQRLLTLEAMKMEHALTAPFDGTVTELNANPARRSARGSCW